MLPSVRATEIKRSPSSSLTAMMPPLRTLEYSTSGVFLTTPFRVAMNRKVSSLNSLTGRMVVIFSSIATLTRLTTAFPLVVRLPSGIS